MCRINKQREIIALDRHGTQQQRLESPTVTPPGMRVTATYVNKEDVPLVGFMYFVSTHMPGWSYCRRFRSLLLCPLSLQRYYFPFACWCPSTEGFTLSINPLPPTSIPMLEYHILGEDPKPTHILKTHLN